MNGNKTVRFRKEESDVKKKKKKRKYGEEGNVEGVKVSRGMGMPCSHTRRKEK